MLSPATEADHPAIFDLVNRAYRGEGRDASWNVEVGLMAGPRITVPYLREDLATKPHARLMLHRAADGAPCACVWLEPLEEGDWYLSMFAVGPALQASGLGRRMLEASETFVAERGGARVRMSVMNVREPLIAWYERRGYERTGEIVPFPYGETRFGTPLRDDLAFVVLAKPLQRLQKTSRLA